MQIGRLFEILYLLLQRESCTAKELAERFEVSTRTIYRDVEALSTAGIPVYATKGRGGGIRIMPGFVLDKSLLTGHEQSEILSALHGFSAATGKNGEVLGKLGTFFKQEPEPWIAIRFASWGGTNQTFELLRRAILEKQVVRFAYHSVGKPALIRDVEPLQLLFQGHTWYLGAYCRKRQDYRLFRLSRIRDVSLCDEIFERVLSSELADQWAWPMEPETSVTIRMQIAPSAAYRVLDEFDPQRVTTLDDGSFLAEATFPPGEWLLGFVLSFGAQAKLLEPQWMVDELKSQVKKVADFYKSPLI